MKKIMFIWVLFLFSTAVFAEGPKPVFRDLHWGDPVKKLGPSIMIDSGASGDMPGVAIYAKKNENHRVDQFTVPKIEYYFWRNQLMIVVFMSDAPKELSSIARARYGKPYEKSAADEKYEDDQTYCKLKILNQRVGIMTLCSTAISCEYGLWEEKQQKK